MQICIVFIFSEKYCGSLNVIGSHNLIENGTIKGCGFVGVEMAFLRKCVTVRVAFEVTYGEDITKCLNQLSVAFKL